MQPIRSLSELRAKAATHSGYRALLLAAAKNLGMWRGDTNNPEEAYRWLETNAMEAGEHGVVEEVNFCLSLGAGKPARVILEFRTEAYEMAHGHGPRGRGSWAFGRDRECGLDDIVWAPSGLTYAEAKRWLREQIKAPGSKARAVFGEAPAAAHQLGGVVYLNAWVAT